MITFRYKNIDLEWCGYPTLCKVGRFLPLKLSYNGTVGWWITSNLFLSYNQLKILLY
jgi:hypothetical protein